MMKPATAVILASLAFLVSACAATADAHPDGPGAPGVRAPGRASTVRSTTHAQAAPSGKSGGQGAPSTLLLGHLIMRVPANWRVTYSDGKGDYTVSTGSCDDAALLGSLGGSRCPSFSMIVDVGAAASPVPTDHAYSRDEPYKPSSGALGCPGKPGTGWRRIGPSNSYSERFAHVSTDTAYYTVWKIGCGPATSNGATTASFYFEQRDWYLPGSQTLIVDEYSIRGLAAVLASATLR